MANTKSASKRARQTGKRALRNRSSLTRLRRMQKRASGTDAKPETLRTLVSEIDKAAKRGTIHKNAANRRKARLTRMFAARAVTPSPA